MVSLLHVWTMLFWDFIIPYVASLSVHVMNVGEVEDAQRD